jgi:phosphoglycolate phosphatase-like HAD superfamily hydrolase
MGIKVLAFDFDGVILDSNEIKFRAFAAIFEKPEFSSRREEIKTYYQSHHAVDRFKKFEHILLNILKQDHDPNLLALWAEQFRSQTRLELKRCPEIAGSMPFISRLRKNLYPVYVVSATPQEELEWIVHQRGWAHLFTALLGSTRPKAEHLRDILRREQCTPKELLFIGDTLDDATAAHTVGVNFVGRFADSVTASAFENLGYPGFSDLDGIADWFNAQTIINT